MSAFTLAGDRHVLLTHMAFYGLAAILDDAGVGGLTLSWSGSEPHLEGADLDAQTVGAAVHDHADRHTAADSWVMRDAEIDGSRRGLMSPRLSVFGSPETWRDVQRRRHAVLGDLTDSRARLDLRMLAALGEPCYWSRNAKGDRLQDDGASRLEMQPRNRGSEFVTNRLRPLALAVARRTPETIVAGLDGTRPIDEIAKGATGGVTATGLAVPGTVDNAVAWCALWGISALPLAARVGGTAATSGHLGRTRREWFYGPVWSGPWRPARLRTVLASVQLRTAAARDMPHLSGGDAPELAAGAWLSARGVLGVVRFPIGRFGSDNAPERRALYGENLALRGVRR